MGHKWDFAGRRLLQGSVLPEGVSPTPSPHQDGDFRAGAEPWHRGSIKLCHSHTHGWDGLSWGGANPSLRGALPDGGYPFPALPHAVASPGLITQMAAGRHEAAAVP